MMHSVNTVGVVGAGAWGTALSVLANRAGAKVVLWSRNPTVVEMIERSRINEAYLPDIFVDPAIRVTMDLVEVCRADVLLLSVPSHYLRSCCIAISDLIDRDMPLVVCSKGIERGSLALMSEIVTSILPQNPVAVLSGPNFADEAAKGLPTATTIASTDHILGEQMLYALGGKYFRPYLTDDVIGTQIGGAVKNVVAIACGIAMGRGFGQNASAALITRGLAEMGRLCLAKGGKLKTLMGLSGIGDLMLTCSSLKSRNMSLGAALGEGRKLEDILHARKQGVTEGVGTAESVTELAHKLNIPMPICSAVRDILAGEIPVERAIHELLERPFSSEKVTE